MKRGDMRLARLGLMLVPVFVASFALAQSGSEKGGGEKRRTGYQDMSPALQQLQDDDTSNPGLLFVQAGEALWKQPAGAANKSCADCHSGIDRMKGVAARYPAIPKDADTPVDLEGRINLCRTGQQRAPALKPESQDLLALSAYVTYASRGLPIEPPDDPRLAPLEQGLALGAKASSISRAPTATTTMPDGSWRAPRSPRPIRRPIRSIVPNGRPWDRCSAGCGIA
jgi:sulfur-oxidizing protein SoxA